MRKLLAVLLCSTSLFAQEPNYGTQINVTAIELTAEVVDRDGRTPADLKPADFVVLEDGAEREVTGVEYIGSTEPAAPAVTTTPAPIARSPKSRNEWRVLLYLDFELSSPATIKDAIASLSAQAEKLASLGTVDVVVATPTPQRLVSTSDPRAIVTALQEAAKITPSARILRLRREWTDARRAMNSIATTKAAKSSNTGSALDSGDTRTAPGSQLAQHAGSTRPYIEQENALIANFYTRLLAWTAKYPRQGPMTLMLVSDGFQTDPGAFYGEAMNDPAASATARNSRSVKAGEMHGVAVREIAAGGWTVYGLRGGIAADFANDTAGRTRLGGTSGEMPGNPVFVSGTNAPLNDFAEATGGAVEADPTKFVRAIDRLRNRVRITYQVSRPSDSVVRKIEVRSRREGLQVRAPKWSSSSSSEQTAAARANGLLESDVDRGELPVEARLDLESDPNLGLKGKLQMRLSLEPLGTVASQLKDATLRVTIAAQQENGPPVIVHQLLRKQDLSAMKGLVINAPLRASKTTRVAAAIEELSTGVWGGTVLTVPASGLTAQTAGWERPATTLESLPAEGSKVAWSSLEEGLRRAAAEKKPLFVYNPFATCENCPNYDRVFNQPLFLRHIQSFVPVRLGRGEAAKLNFTAVDATGVLDPWGRPRLRWHVLESTQVVAHLTYARDISPQIVRAGELLNKDPNSAEAMFTLGFIHVTAGEFGDAARQSQRAEKRAIEEGNEALAQRAAAQNAIAQLKLGKRKEARAIVDKILVAPKTPEIEAEALLVLGHVHAVSGDKKAAVDAYTRAANAAPSASPLQRAAADLAGIAMPALVQEGNRTRALRAVQIVRPWRPIVTGRTNIDTLIRDPFVTRVVFSLDGKVVETVEKAPFSADVDFGATPRAQTLRVQAFGRDGIEIAQDTIVVNERHDDFTVSLIEPLATNGRKTRVAMNLNLPASARLSRIDVYWNETKKAELTQEPFAVDLELPKTPGYVRTVAVLADGRTADDTAIVNLEGFTETVDVELVELYLRVQDRQKRTIPDLTAADFTILDGATPQQIVHAEYVRPPLLIGLAVDTSPSMVEEILDVQSTAIDFMKSAFANDARAFIVGFSETPVLLHETSDDLKSITTELERLRIKGMRTALNDALTFSMLQFEGTKAKKALVFVSDGMDQASRYSIDEVIALARRNSVAIYGIIINSGYKGLRYADGMLRHDIGKLTSETGGKSFYLTDGNNLDAVYKEIDADFGDQYLLTIRPTTRAKAGEWRPLDIRVSRADGRVVGTGGYVAR